jgi:hypothetical protein
VIGKLTLPLMSSPPVEPHSGSRATAAAAAAAAVSILPSLGCVALKSSLSLQWLRLCTCVAFKILFILSMAPTPKLFRALLLLSSCTLLVTSVYLEGRLVPSQ